MGITAAGLAIYVLAQFGAEVQRPAAERAAIPAQQPKPAPQRADTSGWKTSLEEGLAAYRDKRPDDALRLYAEALAEADRSGSRSARALVLSNTGSLYWSMRKLDEAEVNLLRAADIIAKLGKAAIVSDLGAAQETLLERNQRMLGVVYRDQGKHADAARHFQNAVAAAREQAVGTPETRAWVLASNLIELAGAHCRLGNAAATRKALEEARGLTPQTASGAQQLKRVGEMQAELDKGQPCRR